MITELTTKTYLILLNKRFDHIKENSSKEMLDFLLTYRIQENETDHITINISDWNDEEKDSLFKNALRGMHYFSTTFSNNKSFPIGAYNSVIDAIEGKTNFIKLYYKSVRWCSPHILRKIADQGNDMKTLLFPE